MQVIWKSKSAFTNRRTGEVTSELWLAYTWVRAGEDVWLVYDGHEPLRVFDGGRVRSDQLGEIGDQYGMLVVDEDFNFQLCLPDEWITEIPDGAFAEAPRVSRYTPREEVS